MSRGQWDDDGELDPHDARRRGIMRRAADGARLDDSADIELGELDRDDEEDD